MVMEEEVCFKKYEEGKDFDEQKTLSGFRFTGWCLTYATSGYFVVSLEREAKFIGDEIIADLKKSGGEYCQGDIIARVENITDVLRDEMIHRVSKYLESNW